MSGELVLLVGHRRAAIRAARRIGLVPIVLDSKHHPNVSSRVVDFDGATPASMFDTALDLCESSRPVAVVALTEKAVVPAACLREAFGLPGTSYATAVCCRDKPTMKSAIVAAGLPCVAPRVIDENTSADSLVRDVDLPLVIKPRASSGGRGVVVAQTKEDVEQSITHDAIAERYVEGDEVSVEAFVHDGTVVFLNTTDYVVRGYASVAPAELDATEQASIDALVIDACRALGLMRGMAHFEIFRTSQGPVFGEVAARPPGGGLMELIRCAYGFDPWQAALHMELGRAFVFPERASRFASVWLIHPGAGRVRRIEGLDAARAVPGVVSVECNLRVGQVLGPRLGTGQIVGHILTTGASRTESESSLAQARSRLCIEMDAVSDGLAL